MHGEFWEKNILYRDERDGEEPRCIVLDWKNAKIASATKDLAFLILSSTNHLLRTESLSDILNLYFSIFSQTLTKLGVDIAGKMTFEDFYDDYKLSMTGAFLQSVCVLVQEMQYLENQLAQCCKARKNHNQDHGEMLRAFEERTLNLMNDAVSLEIL